MKITALIICLFVITCTSCTDGVTFVVTNKDAAHIDSLHIYVTGNTYLIQNLR